MTRYAAFLRGVNVGGVTLKMADVAAVFTAAGFTDVKTILASGNVLLNSSSSADAVRVNAEAALRASFGYAAWVLRTRSTPFGRYRRTIPSSGRFPSTTPTSPSSATPMCWRN